MAQRTACFNHKQLSFVAVSLSFNPVKCLLLAGCVKCFLSTLLLLVFCVAGTMPVVYNPPRVSSPPRGTITSFRSPSRPPQNTIKIPGMVVC